MNKFRFLIIFLVLLVSFGVRAEDCPFSIKDASVMLSLPNETNLKIASSAMCNQKEFFADRFIDADVELWKKGKLYGRFYARRVSYDVLGLKIILVNPLLHVGELSAEKKLENTHLIFLDLKSGTLSTSRGEIRI